MPAVNGHGDDLLLSFQIDAGAFRGRLIRLGPALDAALGGRPYPTAVAALLAETVALAAALAGALKYDGVFSLQAQGQGPVSLVVADVTSGGDVRAYARYDAERVATAGGGWPALLAGGHLAFTVDQGPDTDRYQGIVELSGDTLADSARRYFEHSEQLATEIRLAARPPQDGTGWRVGALLLQRMPLGPRSPILLAEEAEEAWRRAVILTASLTDEELLDPGLSYRTLLHRLYHADGLWLQEARPLRAACRCSAERVARTLRSFPRRDIEDMRDEAGEVSVVCEFCGSRYAYDGAALDALYG